MKFNNIVNNFLNNKELEDFDQKQLIKGIDIEMEHTDDPTVALEIAMDHLTENPKYYDYLENMEKEMESDLEVEEEAMTAGGAGGVFTAYAGTVDAGEHGGAFKSSDWYNTGSTAIPKGPGKAAISSKDKKKEKKNKKSIKKLKNKQPKALMPVQTRMFPGTK